MHKSTNRHVLAGFLLLTVTACGETQGPALLATEYVLHSVNGQPVPYITDSVRTPIVRDFRIVGRLLAFISADSVQYEEASDVVEPLEDGTALVLAGECFALRTTYVAHSSFIVITIDLNRLPQPVPVPIRHDTLVARGDTLIHLQDIDANRVLRLAYLPRQPAGSVCPF